MKKKIMIISVVFLQFAVEAVDPRPVVPAAATVARLAVPPAAQEELIGALKERQELANSLKTAKIGEKIRIFRERVGKVSEADEVFNDLRERARAAIQGAVDAPTKENLKELVELYDKFRESVAKDMLVCPHLFAKLCTIDDFAVRLKKSCDDLYNLFGQIADASKSAMDKAKAKAKELDNDIDKSSSDVEFLSARILNLIGIGKDGDITNIPEEFMGIYSCFYGIQIQEKI